MTDDVYERLAKALDSLPNGFPRTKSNVEIRILKWIFKPEEALLAGRLSQKTESVERIAERLGLSVKITGERLENMAKRGLLWTAKVKGKKGFRLAPFIVGIYESQLGDMDHEFADLVEEYLANGGAAGIMRPQPAIHRVVPAQKALKSELILPYDDVRKILLSCRAFRLHDCICRVQQDHIGRKCDFPLKLCLSFSQTRLSSQT